MRENQPDGTTSLSLVCAPSPELVEALAMGRVDLAVVEELTGPSAGERLSIERLVWVGAKARDRTPEASLAGFAGGRHLRVPSRSPGSFDRAWHGMEDRL